MIKVLYHVGVDQRKVNALVKQHGDELTAAVDANLARGKSAEAILVTEDIHLYACGQSLAVEQGQPMPDANYLIFGMPADSPIARKNVQMMRHPDSLHLPMDE
jgi:hypothetical protein